MKVNKTLQSPRLLQKLPRRKMRTTRPPESLSSLNLTYEKADRHYSLVQPYISPLTSKGMIGDLPPIKEVPACLFDASEFDSRHYSVSSVAGFLEAMAKN